MSVDVDGPKLFIFLNTVFMSNFSISKKLSHYNQYISLNNPDDFQFDLQAVFARKALKKIWKNVISKFTRLVVAKLIMKMTFPDSDDFVFVLLLGFHQMTFLYYA